MERIEASLTAAGVVLALAALVRLLAQSDWLAGLAARALGY